MGCNLEDVHIVDADEEHELATILELNQDTLTEEGKRDWADVLGAKVNRVYQGYYGTQIEVTGCPPERLQAFSEMLAGYSKICDVHMSIQNRMPHIEKEQIEKLIDLLLLLSKDECRKSLKEVPWEAIEEMLIREYVPYADNGNTDIRMRKIIGDMNELKKVYDTPNMFNDIEIFTKPILKAVMDCIRLINYLERKENPNARN